MKHVEFARRKRGLSQKQLGDQVRIHQSFLSMIERGTGLPDANQRERLAKALGVSADILLDEVEVPEHVHD